MQAHVERSRPFAGRKSITTTGVSREAGGARGTAGRRVTSPTGAAGGTPGKTGGKTTGRKTPVTSPTSETPSVTGSLTSTVSAKSKTTAEKKISKLMGKTAKTLSGNAKDGSCAGTTGNQNVVLVRYTSGTGTMFGLFGSKDDKKDGAKTKGKTVNSPLKEVVIPPPKHERKSAKSVVQSLNQKSEASKMVLDVKDGSANNADEDDIAKDHGTKAPDSAVSKAPKTAKDLREDDSGYHSRENSLEKPWSNKHKRCIMNDRWSPEDSVMNNREGSVDDTAGKREHPPPRRNRPKGIHSRDSSTDRSDSGSSHRNSPVPPHERVMQSTKKSGKESLNAEESSVGDKLVKRKADNCDRVNEVNANLRKDQGTVGDMPRPQPRLRSKMRSPAKTQIRQSSIDETPEEGEEDVSRSLWLKKSLTCSALLPPSTSAEDLLNSNSIEPGCRSGEDLQVTAIVHSEPLQNNNNNLTPRRTSKDNLKPAAGSKARAKTASPLLEVLSQGSTDPNGSPARKSKTFLRKINGWIQDHTMKAEHRAETKPEAKKEVRSHKVKLSHQHSAPEEMASHPSMVRTTPLASPRHASPLHQVRPAPGNNNNNKKLPKQMSLDSAKAIEIKLTVRTAGKSRSQPIPVAIPTPPSLSTPSPAPSSSLSSSSAFVHSENFSSPDDDFVDVIDEALMYERRAKKHEEAAAATVVEETEVTKTGSVGHRKTARDVKRSRSFKDIFRGRSKSRGRDRVRDKEQERQKKIVDSYDLRVERVDLRTRFGLPPLPNKPNGGTPYQDGHGLVSIRMKPDAQGRFGFNVKGGADQGMPIIVSRVAPSTPADLCIPRLNEGDQVLYINGRDVSQHTHEQVVMFIRASRETHSGELVLVVRPNVYIGEDTAEEPDFQYIPDTHHITTTLPQGQDPLAGSLLMLRESLDNGAAITQFEQLYRKKPGMTMNAARLSDNVPKNRYRDISPYDQTRVFIKVEEGSLDYINANYVNMEIPGSGIVNRYVAAQGPLPNTCGDFWQMMWEQQSRLVIMLTTKVERGRVKCHQYWPDLYETIDFGGVQVTCVKEEQTPSFAFREFTLVHTGSSEERHIQQMQYLAWPDHGVPDDSKDFLDFVVKVRQNRVGMVEPTVVHCSAGIGRTGVLVTMETAMCLVEANQPIYPLDIVRQMRDQRAMLIQTTNQYKFVCEAILRVYHERIVQPLADYQR